MTGSATLLPLLLLVSAVASCGRIAPGISDSGPDAGPTCNSVRVLPPEVVVLDGISGEPICDAELVTVCPAPGPVTSACTTLGTLSPCQSCSPCSYEAYPATATSGTFSLDITAPGYTTAKATGLQTSFCACDSDSSCLEPGPVIIKLLPVHKDPGVDGGPVPVDGGFAPPDGSFDATFGPDAFDFPDVDRMGDATGAGDVIEPEGGYDVFPTPPPSDAAPSPGPACPASQPTEGEPCQPVGLNCEYGNNAYPYCNDVWECDGKWSTVYWAFNCQPQEVACPAYDSIHENDVACVTPGQTCGYSQGTCVCGQVAWGCLDAQVGCPSPRPALGTPCNLPPMMTCQYFDPCAGGTLEQCSDGAWNFAPVACSP